MSTEVRIPDQRIAQLARYWQQSVWNELVRRNGTTPVDPIDYLQPGVAIALLGFRQISKDLGLMQDGTRWIRVAGVVDTQRRLISISPNQTQQEHLFTVAHELGHLALHPGLDLHRDRIQNGPQPRRDRVELEADRFASYFLLPERLLRRRFKALFLTERFEMTQETAYALFGGGQFDLTARLRSRRDRSLAVARAVRYNGSHFKSLAEYFGVSLEAMAIKLEELDLVS